MKKQHTLPIGSQHLWKAIALLLTLLASGCATSRLSREARRRIGIQHSKSILPHPANPVILSKICFLN
jgi:hypothetical protein